MTPTLNQKTLNVNVETQNIMQNKNASDATTRKEGTNRQHILGYFSSPDRGIQYALKMWPKIIETYPDAEFHIFYGFDLFLKAYSNNPERMRWYGKVMELIKTQKNIIYHGKIGQDELNEWMKKIGIWFYPTDFEETNCIVALSAQDNGCVPCVINKAALKETVGTGVKIEGEIWDPEVRDIYLKELLSLMGDEKRWQEESAKGPKFASNYYRQQIAKEWTGQFKQTVDERIMSLIYRDEPLIALKIARKHKSKLVPKIEEKLSHVLNWNEYLRKYQDEAVQGFRLDDQLMIQADQAYPRYKWVVGDVVRNGFKSIIDCGCYDGALTMTCANLGLEATGVEMGKDHVKKNIETAKRLGINAKFVQSDILDFNGKADIVTCLEVIEHVPSPKKLIDHLASLGGWVYMSTPLGSYDPKDTRRIWNDPGAKFDHVRTYSVKKLEKLLKDYPHDIFSDKQYLYFRFHK